MLMAEYGTPKSTTGPAVEGDTVHVLDEDDVMSTVAACTVDVSARVANLAIARQCTFRGILVFASRIYTTVVITMMRRITMISSTMVITRCIVSVCIRLPEP